jgi:hypothetical protein
MLKIEKTDKNAQKLSHFARREVFSTANASEFSPIFWPQIPLRIPLNRSLPTASVAFPHADRGHPQIRSVESRVIWASNHSPFNR